MTGRSVLSASSMAAVVSTPSGCIPCWNQLTTTSQRSAPDSLSLSMHVWMRDWNWATVSGW
ncbi:hypothetical protein D3C81_2291030 [compost metagenome]